MIKKLKEQLYLAYSAGFLFCCGVLCLPVLLIRRGPIGNDDSFNQEYPLFIYIGKYIRDAVSGTVRMFDFRIGLGDDVIAALNWHGFGDVFQVFSALFPAALSEAAYAFVMVLKFYLCGISFLLFSKRYLRSGATRIAGALLYAFSLFGIVKGLDFWVFLNPLITFPLIIAGVDDVRENRRKPAYPLIFGLCLQALGGFYFLYMEILLSILYFVITGLFEEADGKDSRVRKLWNDGLFICLQALLGIGLGAVILIPAVAGYFDSSRTGAGEVFSSIRDLFLYQKDYYLTCLKCLIVPEAWESIITFSLLVVLGVIAAFTTEKFSTGLKALCIILLAGLGMPLAGSIMNGFSYCTDRWYFGLQLFLILLAMLGMEHVARLTRKQIVIFYMIAAGLIGYNTLADGLSKGVCIRNGALLFCALILPFLWNRKRRESLLLLAACLLIILNGCITLGHSKIGGSGYAWRLLPLGSALARMQEEGRLLENAKVRSGGEDTASVFERQDIYSSSLSNAMVMDYYGTTEYFSTLNGNVSEFYRTLNIAPGVRSATWILKGLDSREELLSLLSVGQYTDFYTDAEGVHAEIKKNENVLPLGFTFTEAVNRSDFEALSVPDMQSVLLKAVVLEDGVLGEDAGKITDLTDENQEIPCRAEYGELSPDNGRFKTKEGSHIRVYLDTDREDIESVYVQLQDFIVEDEGIHELYVGNKNLQLRNRDDDYYMGYDTFWVYVTELLEENGRPYFDLRFPAENGFCLGGIRVYRHIPDTDAVAARSRHTLQELQIGQDRITGSLETERREWLFLSIPYSRGWRAYIDGKRAEVQKADIGFLAVLVPEGRHEISLCYRTPGLLCGMTVTIISILLLIVLVLVQRKEAPKEKMPG